MEHKYSTWTLIALFFILLVGFSWGLDSYDVDELCKVNNSILFRYNDTWMCSSLNDTVINYTINEIINIFTNWSIYSDFWDGYDDYDTEFDRNILVNRSYNVTFGDDVLAKSFISSADGTYDVGFSNPVGAKAGITTQDAGGDQANRFIIGGNLDEISHIWYSGAKGSEVERMELLSPYLDLSQIHLLVDNNYGLNGKEASGTIRNIMKISPTNRLYIGPSGGVLTGIEFRPGTLTKMFLDRDGNLNATGNITSENVFIPQYIFSHTDRTQVLKAVNVWTNVTFDQEVADISYGISHVSTDDTNNTFTIMEDGIYEVDYDFDVEDSSGTPSDIDVAGRLVLLNGTEIIGSVFETDIAKQGISTELSHDFLIRCLAGEQFKFQFVADNGDVQISTHGTFGDHPESATIVIKKVANL